MKALKMWEWIKETHHLMKQIQTYTGILINTNYLSSYSQTMVIRMTSPIKLQIALKHLNKKNIISKIIKICKSVLFETSMNSNTKCSFKWHTYFLKSLLLRDLLLISCLIPLRITVTKYLIISRKNFVYTTHVLSLKLIEQF